MKRAAPVLLLLAALLPARKFYADDPLSAEPPPLDAAGAARRKLSDYYDFFLQTFGRPSQNHPGSGPPIPSQAVNTLGEPMEGPWYKQRHYFHPMTMEELVRGAGDANAPSLDGPWTIVKAKSEGVTPGFEFVDSRKRRYVLKFDPIEFPEVATAPDVIVSKIFYALGYHVPENYIVRFRRDQLVLGKNVELIDSKGRVRGMTGRDITGLLQRAPRDKEGMYRGGASLFLQGKPLGPFRYFGVRRDDPNDIFRHEHRRDLRALSVFCAWLGHDDSRAINTLDMLVNDGGTPHIRHHLIDFGSALGSASSGPNTPRSGFEYLFEWTPMVKQMLTFGVLIPRWSKARYPDLPAAGRFESRYFDPVGWVAEYKNPAFANRLPEDAFWAAKQVMAFTDGQIRALVATGQYSDPQVENYIAGALLSRRDKIGRAFFAQVLPLDRFRVEDGSLIFDDLEVLHKFRGSRRIQYQWFTFDNETAAKTPLPGAATSSVPDSSGAFLACQLSAGGRSRTVYLREGKVVAVE